MYKYPPLLGIRFLEFSGSSPSKGKLSVSSNLRLSTPSSRLKIQMKPSEAIMNALTLALATGLAATAAAAAAAETVHGALVFSRHGDRTTKHFGSQVLTPLGATQAHQVGSDYRARYLAADSPHRIKGISEFQYVPAQVYASAPDQSILLDTATSFLQGFYPPLGELKADLTTSESRLANGSSVEGPVNGYQYVQLHGVDVESPETIWIKGDDECPALIDSSAAFQSSNEFASRLNATRDFYRSLWPLVSDMYPSVEYLTYAKAYDIFDVINVARIHNASSPARKVTDAQLFQLRTLADSAEFGLNYNASEPARSLHASTLAGAIVAHLRKTVESAAHTPKFTYLSGSYDTFLAFFGIFGLTDASSDFFGLPEYASTMAFELFTPEATDKLDEDSLRVRFLFRNGTAGALTQFPLFGKGKADLSWTEFMSGMLARGVTSTQGWCNECGSEAAFCAQYKWEDNVVNGVYVPANDSVKKGSWIGVLVVMCVAIVGNLVWAAMWLIGARRQRAEKKRLAAMPAMAKTAASMSSFGKESV
ncbi:hypothetical protein N0V88_007111 [Collariella sp. IMI 366227]|nr:hypothetical protein N0V88_007111 [Collariella sp. IMI 366227]